MAINELVEKIIDKRHEKLPVLESKSEMLDNLTSALENFDNFKSEVVDAEGNPVDGKYNTIINQHPEMVYKLNAISSDYCKNSIVKAQLKLQEAEKRFKRENISISVVGHARIGKSRFLQSVSNLSDYVIPAFSDSDCTGARSVIQNRPGTELEAHITFKSEAEMVEIVQTYLDRILPDPDKRMVIRTLNNIRDINLDEVENRMVDGNSDNNLLKYLKKLVLNFEEWASCIRQKDVVLYDEKEIMTYVAQNNGIPKNKEGREEYYKYLAVKTCDIYCTFDYEEAGKITLIDTVGIDDNAIGIEEEMVKAVNEESDAAIFMLFPLNLAGSGISKGITNIYKKISTDCNNKNLDKWLYWLINFAPDHPKTPNLKEFCEQTLETLENNRWHGAMRKIIDVSDQTQVREEFLIPLLNNLLDNLDDIDNLYLKDVQDALDDVKKEYLAFCSAVKKVMESNMRDAIAMQPNVKASVDGLVERISSNLFKLSLEEKAKRDIPCDTLNKEIKTIINDMRNGTMIPARADMVEELYAEQGQAGAVYRNRTNYLRNELTKKFSDVEFSLKQLVADLKNRITMLVVSDEVGKLGRLINLDESRAPYEWLNDFTETVLDEEIYPNLHYAFSNLYKFDFSVKGFLTYEVRACLDLIDPALSGDVQIGYFNSMEQTADEISFWIERNLIDVADELTRKLDELMRKPNRAFFAAVKEFSDQIKFSEDVENEWHRLLSENFQVIWAEEYRKMAIASASFAEWEDVLNSLLQYSAKANMFSIK